MRVAAREVQCDLCRAMTRQVWLTATEREGAAPRSMHGAALDAVVAEACAGQVPLLLQRHTIVPRGRSRGYALGCASCQTIAQGVDGRSVAQLSLPVQQMGHRRWGLPQGPTVQFDRVIGVMHTGEALSGNLQLVHDDTLELPRGHSLSERTDFELISFA